MAHLHFGFETIGNVSLSNFKCKRRAIRKRLKRQKKKGGKGAGGFGESGEKCDFTVSQATA
jgi:hypothetical protein